MVDLIGDLGIGVWGDDIPNQNRFFFTNFMVGLYEKPSYQFDAWVFHTRFKFPTALFDFIGA